MSYVFIKDFNSVSDFYIQSIFLFLKCLFINFMIKIIEELIVRNIRVDYL